MMSTKEKLGNDDNKKRQQNKDDVEGNESELVEGMGICKQMMDERRKAMKRNGAQ